MTVVASPERVGTSELYPELPIGSTVRGPGHAFRRGTDGSWRCSCRGLIGVRYTWSEVVADTEGLPREFIVPDSA